MEDFKLDNRSNVLQFILMMVAVVFMLGGLFYAVSTIPAAVKEMSITLLE